MKNIKEILVAGYKRATSDNHLTLITTIYGVRINLISIYANKKRLLRRENMQ